MHNCNRPPRLAQCRKKEKKNVTKLFHHSSRFTKSLRTSIRRLLPFNLWILQSTYFAINIYQGICVVFA